MCENNSEIFNDKCTNSIGCRAHRKWDKTFVRKFAQPIGFSNLDFSYTNKKYQYAEAKKVKQYLCYLANHEYLTKTMENFSYSCKCLKELSESDVGKLDVKQRTGYCLGLNSGMGTDFISVRLKSMGKFLPYNTIISTLIHELTHFDVSNHGSEFIERQEEIRQKYNNYEIIDWTDNSLYIFYIKTIISFCTSKYFFIGVPIIIFFILLPILFVHTDLYELIQNKLYSGDFYKWTTQMYNNLFDRYIG